VGPTSARISGGGIGSAGESAGQCGPCVHGLDAIMRQTWQQGTVLAGVSAGALCWFEGGTTDSFGPALRPFTAGLPLLPGSYCPLAFGDAIARPCNCRRS